MNATTYRCINCESGLHFDGAKEKLVCPSCSTVYELHEMEELATTWENHVDFDATGGTYQPDEVKAYTCNACGAELLTEATTTSTQCPYCSSPIVLNANIDAGVKPEYIIPFTVTKESALKLFEEYFKGKKLMPNVFLDTRNRISEMRKLYVPYWLFDCYAWGDVLYDCKRTSVSSRGKYRITKTAYYVSYRSGGMQFENIPVDASKKMDNKITESIEPYDFTKAIPFESAMLAGAMADHADVDTVETKARIIERVEVSMENKLRSTVHGFNSVSVRSSSFRSENGKITPVLLPIWLITTEKEENGEKKVYTFAINGQTGKLTCDVPPATGKSLGWGAGVFAGAFGICALIAALTGYLSSGTLLVSAIAALIAALIVVGALRSQLKTAAFQHNAGNYQKDETFELPIHYERFIHETTSTTKID